MILEVHADAPAAARAAAALLCGCVGASRGEVHVALSAGRAVTAMLEALPDVAARRGPDWSRTTLIVADERAVPTHDPRRNDAVIARGLARVDAHAERDGRLVRMAPETGATQAVRALTDRLAHITTLDLAMLGLGDDGHVASLFPGHRALDAAGVAVHLDDAPADPAGRTTLTLGWLSGARERVVVTAGHAKRDAIAGLVRGADLPVTRWRPTRVVLDAAALPDGTDERLVRRAG